MHVACHCSCMRDHKVVANAGCVHVSRSPRAGDCILAEPTCTAGLGPSAPPAPLKCKIDSASRNFPPLPTTAPRRLPTPRALNNVYDSLRQPLALRYCHPDHDSEARHLSNTRIPTTTNRHRGQPPKWRCYRPITKPVVVITTTPASTPPTPWDAPTLRHPPTSSTPPPWR